MNIFRKVILTRRPTIRRELIQECPTMVIRCWATFATYRHLKGRWCDFLSEFVSELRNDFRVESQQFQIRSGGGFVCILTILFATARRVSVSFRALEIPIVGESETEKLLGQGRKTFVRMLSVVIG